MAPPPRAPTGRTEHAEVLQEHVGAVGSVLLASLLLLPGAAVGVGATLVGCDAGYAGSGCCRTCTTGRACGDSCIAAHLTCHQPPGCACDG